MVFKLAILDMENSFLFSGFTNSHLMINIFLIQLYDLLGLIKIIEDISIITVILLFLIMYMFYNI